MRHRSPTAGQIDIDVAGLRSGNGLYDAELLRRIDARRFPTATVELRRLRRQRARRPVPPGRAPLTFHGVTETGARGRSSVEGALGDRLVITGEQVFDIRDFAIPSPTVLMLRIYPDVRVRLQAEAERED